MTKKGKVMRMNAGHNHFRAKNRSSQNSDFRHSVSSTVKATVKLVKLVGGKAAQG